MDGTRLFEAFEQNAPRMRKVMMTGDPNPPWNSIRASRNADAYLTKPVDLDVLLATVQEQLSKQRGED
jgi:DNA-binding NtrC family response regulator